MDFFDRHKALLITILLFSVLMLAMLNIKLANSNKENTSTLIDLASFSEILQEPEEEEPETPEELPKRPTPSLSTHQAFNQDQQESESLESRLKEIFERNSAKSTASEEQSTPTQSGEASLSRNTTEERRNRSDGENNSEEISAKSGNFRNSSISFSLLGRSAVTIPNPIYTCDTSGKIVVNIKVNAEGLVISTSINQASSTSTNECLVEKAMEYAANAVFSPLAGRNGQPGTITYNFQG